MVRLPDASSRFTQTHQIGLWEYRTFRIAIAEMILQFVRPKLTRNEILLGKVGYPAREGARNLDLQAAHRRASGVSAKRVRLTEIFGGDPLSEIRANNYEIW